MRILICRLLLLFAGLNASGAWSAADDPFRTEARVEPLPAAGQPRREGGLPCTVALPATPLTAIEAVDLTLCNNPQTREIWANARVQAAQVGVARSAWLPGIEGRAGVGRNFAESRDFNQSTASVSLSWLLLDFGQRTANLAVAEQLLVAASASRSAAVQSLYLAALQGFYAAQATRAAVVALGKAERSAEESYQAAEARYKAGVATPADRLQAQTARSQATLNRIRAEGDFRNAQGNLASVMGFDATHPLVLAEPGEIPATVGFQREVDAQIEDARQARPDLRAAEAQLGAAEAGVALARAQGRPTVSLSAGPSWQDIAGVSSRGGSLGLSLNVPIFTGFETTYRVRSAEAQADVRAAQRDRVRAQIALDVWRAYQSLTTATQSLQTTQDLVASAEQSERVALGRYKAGVGTVLDLLSAQSALASARLQRIQAQLDWHVFRATLAQAMGALDDTLLQPAAGGTR